MGCGCRLRRIRYFFNRLRIDAHYVSDKNCDMIALKFCGYSEKAKCPPSIVTSLLFSMSSEKISPSSFAGVTVSSLPYTRRVLLGIFLAILAHSFGARVAIKLLSQRPELCGRLIITGGAGIVKPRSPQYIRRVKRYRIAKKFFPRFAEKHFGSEEYKNLSPVMKGVKIRLFFLRDH